MVRRLRAGQTRTQKVKVIVEGHASELLVIAVLDATNVVQEINEGNNVVVSPPIP